jgi:hypothetical protein
MGPDDLADHLAQCRQVDAALVGGTGVDMTETVQMLIAAGWTYKGTEYVAGKRVRYLAPPPPEENREENR